MGQSDRQPMMMATGALLASVSSLAPSDAGASLKQRRMRPPPRGRSGRARSIGAGLPRTMRAGQNLLTALVSTGVNHFGDGLMKIGGARHEPFSAMRKRALARAGAAVSRAAAKADTAEFLGVPEA